MLQAASTQPQPIPAERDITIKVREKDAASKKEHISWTLQSVIDCEYRKYNKAKTLLSAGPSFSHTRCIHFVLDHAGPLYLYDEVISYRLCFNAAGVIIEPASPNPDPDVTPFPDPVCLKKVKTVPAEINKEAPIVPMPEVRYVMPTRTPSIPAELDDRPQFRFGGKYLERYGFTIGTPVTVYLEQNKITLTVTSEDQLNKELA
jgi:hypothetical protein